MRRTLTAMVAGLVVGAFGWQVGFAAEPALDTLVVCERPSADVRSPSSTGKCPSGYRRTEITETGPATTNPAYTREPEIVPITGPSSDPVAVATMTLPPGAYLIVANGTYALGDGPLRCHLLTAAGVLANAALSAPVPGGDGSTATVTTTAAFDTGTAIEVHCVPHQLNGTGLVQWELIAVRVDGIVVPPA